jgi:hypothetical protein
MSETFDVDELLNEVLAEFNECLRTGVEMKNNPSPSTSTKFSSGGIYNLLSNSVKYKKDNGPLRLKITYDLESGKHGTRVKIIS